MLGLLCSPGWGSDLLSVYELALASDPIYQTDSLTYDADKELITQARAALLPNIDVIAARVRTREELSSDADFITPGDATFTTDEYGIALTQVVFDRAKQLTLKQARLRTNVSAFLFTAASQDLIVRVTTRYFAVLAAYDNLTLAVSEREALAEQLELAEKRLEVGLGIKTDLYDAQARYSVAQAQEIEAQNLLDDAYQALAEIIGETPHDLEKLREERVLEEPKRDMQSWIDESQDNNLELLVARETENVARTEYERQKAGRYPFFDFIVRYNVDDADGSISGPGIKRTGTDALLRLVWPIYQGGLVSSLSREAELRYQATRQQTERARRAAIRRTRAAFLGIVASLLRVDALKAAVTAQESAVEAKREGFAAGLDTNLQVLDAQRDLFRAARDYYSARYEYILNVLRLKQAVGTLDEDDLRLVNGWLG